MELTKVLLKDKTQPNVYELSVKNGQLYSKSVGSSYFYKNPGFKKTFKITIDGVVYENKNITIDGLTFKQSLYSTDVLDFSCVEKGELSFDLINFRQDVKAVNGSRFKLEHFVNDILTITEYYTIYDIYKKNDNLVTIKAYDDLVLFDKDVTTWFNSLKPNNTFTEVYNGLLTQVGYTDKTLPSDINGNLLCKGSIKQNEVKGYQVLGWLQERVQGFFKPVRGELKLKFIRLNSTTPEEVFTPNDIKNVYISDYQVKPITKAQIKATEKDIGGVSGNGTNAYIIQANPFYNGMTSEELAQASTELLNNVKNITWTPFKGTFSGYPSLEVGSLIQVTTRKNTVAKAWLNKRTLKIRQMIIDDIECQGKEKREEIKLVNKHLEILRQRTLEIEATVDKFETKMTNIETENGQIKKEMSTITQTSNQIKTDVQTVKEDLSKAQSTITQNSEKINLQVKRTSMINYLNGFKVTPELFYLGDDIKEVNGVRYTLGKSSLDKDGNLVVTRYAKANADYIDACRTANKYINIDELVGIKDKNTGIFNINVEANVSKLYQLHFKESKIDNLNCWREATTNNKTVYGFWHLSEYYANGFSSLFNTYIMLSYPTVNLRSQKTFSSSTPITKIGITGLGLYAPSEIVDTINTSILRTLPDINVTFGKPCLLIGEPLQPAGFYTSTVNQSALSEINMSPDAIKIKAEKIDLQGYVTVSDLSGQNKTTIDGSNIKTGIISANRLDLSNTVTVGKLSQSGGTTINGDNIKTGTINAMTINAPRLQNVSTINGVSVNQGKNDITVANWDGNLVVLHYNNGIITSWQILGYDRRANRVPTQSLHMYRTPNGLTQLGTWEIYTDTQGIVKASSGHFFQVYAGNNGMLRCPFDEVQGTLV